MKTRQWRTFATVALSTSLLVAGTTPAAFAATNNDGAPSSSPVASTSGTPTPPSSPAPTTGQEDGTSTGSGGRHTQPSDGTGDNSSAANSSNNNPKPGTRSSNQGGTASTNPLKDAARNTPSLRSGTTWNPDTIVQDPVDDGITQAAKKRFGNPLTITLPTATSKGAGVIPKGLEKYYKQKPTWTNCRDFYSADDPKKLEKLDRHALCTFIVVPMDYSKPNGKMVAVAMLKIPATDQAHKKGTIFMDPGGPGGSGMDTMSEEAIFTNEKGQPKPTPQLTENYDQIGFDPRGVGHSMPFIRCESNDAKDKLESSDLPINEQYKYRFEQCLNNTGLGFADYDTPQLKKELLASFNTQNVARDLDVMRSVVGDKKLTYVGFSYGTSIAYAYTVTFPENVRAIVADAVVDVFENEPAYRKKAYGQFIPKLEDATGDDEFNAKLAAFMESFTEFGKYCVKKHGDDCPVYDPTQPHATDKELETNFYTTAFGYLRKIKSDPTYSRPDGRTLDFGTFLLALMASMYSKTDWDTLIAAFNEVKNDHKFDGLLKILDDYQGIWTDDTGKRHHSRSDETLHVINCLDTPGDKTAIVAAQGLDGKSDLIPCEILTRTKTYPNHSKADAYRKLQAAKNLQKVFVVSAHKDNATPYENGVIMAAALNGIFLTTSRVGHCSYDKVSCATMLTNYYLTDPEGFTKAVQDKTLNTQFPYIVQHNVETKNIYSEIIKGDSCAITNFPLHKPTPQPSEVPATVAAAASYRSHGLAKTGSNVASIALWAMLIVLAGSAMTATGYSLRHRKNTAL